MPLAWLGQLSLPASARLFVSITLLDLSMTAVSLSTSSSTHFICFYVVLVRTTSVTLVFQTCISPPAIHHASISRDDSTRRVGLSL